MGRPTVRQAEARESQELREDEGVARAIGTADWHDGMVWQVDTGIQFCDWPVIPLANLGGINIRQRWPAQLQRSAAKLRQVRIHRLR